MNQTEKKKHTRRKRTTSNEGTIPLRDPLLAYKKPQLMERLRKAELQAQTAKQQLAMSVDTSMKREARITELEARLAELEPYRSFVEQMRAQMQQEERGRFGNLPPSP